MSVNKSDGIRARVVSESRRAPARMTGAPSRWLKGMIDTLDSHSFDPYDFAYVFSNANVHVQRQFIRFLGIYLGILAQKFEMGLYEDATEMLLQQDAHLIHKHMRFLDAE